MAYRKTAEFEKIFTKERPSSEEQDKIFEQVSKFPHNVCISASAGAGKTTTITGIISLLPANKKKLVLMHNRSVRDDMVKKLCEIYLNENKDKKEIEKKEKEAKLKEKIGININTVHGLGMAFLWDHKEKIKALQGDREKLEGIIKDENDVEQKYFKYIKENIKELTNNAHLNSSKELKYRANLLKLIQFSQINLCQTEKEIQEIVKKYGINCILNEVEATFKILKWGKSEEGLHSLAYSDLLWLPSELNITQPSWAKYDYIFVDEVQDLSPAHIKLIQKLYRRGVKIIVVGDKYQQINSWCGATEDAMKDIKNACGGIGLWKDLELKTTYRCGKKIIEEVKKANAANNLNVEIEAFKNNPDGKILYNVRLSDIPNGSLILCRISSPLFELYFKLLEQGHCVAIKGEKSLTSELSGVIENLGDTSEEIYLNECREFINELSNACINNNCDENQAMKIPYVNSKYMELKTIGVLTNRAKNKEGMLEILKEIPDEPESEDCITLSTIHRAKGGQSNNVYIACPSFIKSPFINEDLPWEIQSEKNLEYVAKTRAKQVLGYISEQDIHLTKNMDTSQRGIMDEVEEIKKLVAENFGETK